jgi:hypothetical protein
MCLVVFIVEFSFFLYTENVSGINNFRFSFVKYIYFSNSQYLICINLKD